MSALSLRQQIYHTNTNQGKANYLKAYKQVNQKYMYVYTCMYVELPLYTQNTILVAICFNIVMQDHACLHFTPSAPLILPPHSVTTVTVECRPLVAGRLRSMVQCVMEDKVIQ